MLRTYVLTFKILIPKVHKITCTNSLYPWYIVSSCVLTNSLRANRFRKKHDYTKFAPTGLHSNTFSVFPSLHFINVHHNQYPNTHISVHLLLVVLKSVIMYFNCHIITNHNQTFSVFNSSLISVIKGRIKLLVWTVLKIRRVTLSRPVSLWKNRNLPKPICTNIRGPLQATVCHWKHNYSIWLLKMKTKSHIIKWVRWLACASANHTNYSVIVQDVWAEIN